MAYFMLECYGPADQERQAIDRVPTGVAWNRGVYLDPNAVSTPLEVIMDGDGLMMPMFNRGILLFRDDLLSALKSAGVENLQLFDAVLIDPVANVRYETYKAVNVVGLIAAADLEKSEYSTPSGIPRIDTDFDSLALDPSKIKDTYMFRLAESVNAIVIRHNVKQAVEGAGIPYIDFVEPEEWFG